MTKQIAIVCLFLLGFVLNTQASADEAAVRKTLASYVEVFNSKAAERVGSFWTENGSHTDRVTGFRTEGRAAIQADITEVLKSPVAMKLSATVDKFRLVTADVARVEGETTVVMAGSDPMTSSYIAILVKKGDQWLLDSIEEMSLQQPASTIEALKDLAWLIGDWVDDSGDVKVSTSFRWTANQAFMLRSFSVETKAGLEMTGTQVIGWDPRVQQIRGWSFNSNGSFGESTWTKTDSSWLSKTIQTLANGDSASGTYVMEKLDDNSFSMQLLGHELNGVPQPAGPAVKIIRTPTEQTSDSTSGN